MKFLSNGDFVFPFGPALYWAEHLFAWSFQTGAPNLEGIIRLPARLLNMLVFQIFGNVAFGYFYLFISLLIIFFAFFIFSRSFLGVKSLSLCIVGSLLFTLNPIFLGNLAKVGLIIAVAMLPLCLVVLKKLFIERRVGFLLVYILLLNISLVHPYTFTVNLIISGAYGLFLAVRHYRWLWQNALKILGVAVVALLMNAYFVLPILSVGSIDKTVLSQDLASDPVDYSALVSVANTGDMLTALAFTKDVFKDFEFFNEWYRPIYFVGVILLYAVLIGGFVLAKKTLPPASARLFLAYIGLVLLFLLLSTGMLFGIDNLIKFLITLPGGWMFRSPLKWQLYIPPFLVAALLLVMAYLPKKIWRQTALAMLVGAIVSLNGYVAYDVWQKILVPRQMQEFARLQDTNLDNTTMLFATTDDCLLFAEQNPRVFTELNQVFASKTMQVKRVNADRLDVVNLENYDYALSCKGSLNQALPTYPTFIKTQTFSGGAVELYQNQNQQPLVYATSELFSLVDPAKIQRERRFVAQNLKQPFNYTAASEERQAVGLYELFGDLSPENIKDKELATSSLEAASGQHELYIKEGQTLFSRQEGDRVTLSPTAAPGFTPLPEGEQVLPITSSGERSLEFRYRDESFDYRNLIPNPSFESGAWQNHVTDCNNFDSAPIIDMQINKNQKTDGFKSLSLSAKRHIACTGPESIAVEPGDHYLLSFDYRVSDSKRGGYFIGFNDEQKSFVAKRLAYGEGWQQMNRVIEVPPGATSLTLLVYAYPDYTNGLSGDAQYDNFYLGKVPPIQGSYFLVSNRGEALKPPASLTIDTLAPTARTVHIKGATTPFYVVMRETFHWQWRLELNNSKVNDGIRAWLPNVSPNAVAQADHFAINGTMNGWYIDPGALCQANQGCIKNADGSYDMELLIEYVPQRWLYAGLLVSGAALLGVVGFIVVRRWRATKGAGNA